MTEILRLSKILNSEFRYSLEVYLDTKNAFKSLFKHFKFTQNIISSILGKTRKLTFLLNTTSNCGFKINSCSVQAYLWSRSWLFNSYQWGFYTESLFVIKIFVFQKTYVLTAVLVHFSCLIQVFHLCCKTIGLQA